MKSASTFCGRMSIGLTDILRGIAGSATTPSWWPYDIASTMFTHRGRDAIWHGLRALNLQPGDRVLVPAYHCGSEVDVLARAGLDLELYEVDERGRANEDAVLARLTPDVKMIYVIHMFGWPQLIPRVRQAARESHCPIMEDCALSLFSMDDDVPIGSRGDIAIFSMPKTFGVPDGGALVLNSHRLGSEQEFRTAPRLKVLKRMLGLLKTRLRSSPVGEALSSVPRNNAIAELQKSIEEGANLEQRPDIPASYYFDPATTGHRMSEISRRIVSGIDSGAVVRRRCDNYARLAEQLREIEGIAIWNSELDAGVCPLVMPILVDNSLRCATYLQRVGIAASAWWWGFHKDLNYDAFPQVQWLKRSVVALPMHQEFKERQLKYIVSAVREYQAHQPASHRSNERHYNRVTGPLTQVQS